MGVSRYLTFFSRFDQQIENHYVFSLTMHFLYLVPNSFSSEIKIILNSLGLGWDSIFRTKILCCHTILIVYEEKVFLARYPLLTISITHCVTYDLMMIGRKEKKISPWVNQSCEGPFVQSAKRMVNLKQDRQNSHWSNS